MAMKPNLKKTSTLAELPSGIHTSLNPCSQRNIDINPQQTNDPINSDVLDKQNEKDTIVNQSSPRKISSARDTKVDRKIKHAVTVQFVDKMSK